ncbi:zinc ribbon domain-containing protein [Gorillibacterium timonense]|uniref:zinc ribbon domain-containing protein n=1 Tax=Gorillibacterium timonense TaxID=1689269 RepID=UPI0009E845E5|nr:zinc ribbon domain-containing protein [Gorillibacterium timonense]
MIMTALVFCQSCAMPLAQPEDHGTQTDGMLHEEYCCYCFKDGGFTTEETMDEMIESCVPHVSNGNPYPDANTARTAMKELFPKLKRWAASPLS